MRALRSSYLLFVCFLAAACSQGPEPEAAETSEHAVEVFGQDLWAGLASVTIERYAADPCGDGRRRLDDEPIVYDTWVRQRAGVRNVCFEVWKPGVTDTENPDFWRLLDVQVHYRYRGTTAWKMAYVPAIDRRGNNRRYVWSLSHEIDPLAGSNVADAKAPFEIVAENPTYATARAELEFYFTVNGHELSTSTNGRFRVAYTNYVDKPTFAVAPSGNVLYPEVTCAGLRLGSGAGFFVADVTDPAAVDVLGAGASGAAKINAARIGIAGTGATRVLSLPFGERDASGRYVDGGYGGAWRAEAKAIGGGKTTLTVKAYDRASKQVEPLSWTFAGCTTP